MIATAPAESTSLTGLAPVEQRVVTSTPASAPVLIDRPDPARARELDLVAAQIEGAARGVGTALFLALVVVAFVVATTMGLLA